MRVLSLDLAARTGFAIADSGKIVDSGDWLLEGDRAARYDALYRQIEGVLSQHGPRFMIYERPFARGAGTRVLWGYAAIAELCAHRNGIASIDELPNSLKKWATGSGHADKDAMIAEAERRTGISPRGSDEADAVLLALYACDMVVVGEDLAS